MLQQEIINNNIYKLIKNFVGKQVSDTDDRNDIVQNVFLKVFEKSNQLHDEEKLKSWIYKIAQNAIYDYHRKLQKIPYSSNENLEILSTDNQNGYQEMNNCLNPFINKLPDIYKSAIYSSEIQNIPLQTIANETNTPLSTIKSRVQRAKKMIKEMYIDCCHFTIGEDGFLKGEHKDPALCTKCKS